MNDDDLIPISALQHYLFCPRQYALIHLEMAWEDNQFTAEGNVLHERVDKPGREKRKLFSQEFRMGVRSLSLGLVGFCDLVETEFSSPGIIEKIIPVEFKRGRRKADEVDMVQLCAQALCLEEMFSFEIPFGEIYYLQEHRRRNIELDDEIREKTKDLVSEIRVVFERRKTPLVEYEPKKCDRCSLIDICMPRYVMKRSKNVTRFVKNQLSGIDRACMEQSEVIYVPDI